MSEVRTTSSTGGQKGVKDERYDLIPVEALAQLARHYGVGARKYDDNQWRKGYEFSKSYAALMRHLTQWWGGEDIDEETGSNHMAAVAWHAFTLLTFQQFNPEFDDRFTTVDPYEGSYDDDHGDGYPTLKWTIREPRDWDAEDREMYKMLTRQAPEVAASVTNVFVVNTEGVCVDEDWPRLSDDHK